MNEVFESLIMMQFAWYILIIIIMHARESLLENTSVFVGSNEADSQLKGWIKCYCQCQNALTT